jgi:hypothetical protein
MCCNARRSGKFALIPKGKPFPALGFPTNLLVLFPMRVVPLMAAIPDLP